MSHLMQASNQWASRPADERFASLVDMQRTVRAFRENCHESVIASTRLECVPMADHKGLTVMGPNSVQYAPTHWSFGQLAQLAEAPAGYLRTMPADIAADCINWGLQMKRSVADVGLLTYVNGDRQLRAATGPRYGRIWNADIVDALVTQFGDGVSGDGFRVPGEFGKRVDVTADNTTLFASDRDMFVFLADEEHRIEIPNRRAGQAGMLARGFFVWNSEVGDKTFGIATFLFDYVCCNRIVWGAQEYGEIKIRHSAAAPERFLREITPALEHYAASSATTVTAAIEQARAAKIGDADAVSAFLAKRFSKRVAETVQTTHQLEEGRPIETLWDATTGVTAYARTVANTDERVALEREAGDIMALGAA